MEFDHHKKKTFTSYWNNFAEMTQSYFGHSDPLRGVTMGSGDYIQNKFNNKLAWANENKLNC